MNEALANLIQLHELEQELAHEGGTACLRDQIDHIRTQLPAELLRQFDQLVRHGHLPVALLSKSGACGSCHLQLTPADVLRFRIVQDQILTCPQCGCFLYAFALRENEARTRVSDRTARRPRKAMGQSEHRL
jgi:predicted  nucleic acid-binding Zn-ribbon protein